MKITVKPKQVWTEREPYEVDHNAAGHAVPLHRYAEVLDVIWISETKPALVHLKLHVGTTMFETISESTLRRRWKLTQDVKL